MAGLIKFIHGNQPPLPVQPTRTDRLAHGAKAKVPAKKSIIHSASEPFASTSRIPEYSSSPAAGQNTHPNSRYPLQQQQVTDAPKRTFDDTSVSGLEETESDVGFYDQQMDTGGVIEYNQDARIEDDYNEDGAGMEEDDARYPTQHRKPYTADYEPHNRPTTPRGNAISGRFHPNAQNQQPHANLELRPNQNGNSTAQQLKGSKKRNRSDMQGHEVPGPPLYRNVDALGPDEELEELEELDELDNSIGAEKPSNPPVPSRHPDFEDQELEGMTYKDLKDQTWDVEKYDNNSRLPQELRDSAIPLSDRFQSCLEIDEPEAQLQFFATMPIAEWEEAGDLFIEKFAEIITKLKEARREKRKIATKFEEEVEAREAAIRAKSASLDQDLTEMRKGGEGVLKGKMV